MDALLFNKYQEITFQPDGTLFGISPYVATHLQCCPFCGRKLYKMKKGPLFYCKAKTCGNRIQNGKTFVLHESKLKKKLSTPTI